jgi:glucokinase
MRKYLLAGDVGGSKTTLTIVDVHKGPKAVLEKETFKSGDYASLTAIVQEFRQKSKFSISMASFGIAGPVSDGEVRATNLPWVITESSLSDILNIPVKLLNDLAATAYAVPFLEQDELIVVNQGKRAEQGTIGVIAPGTGLGEAYMIWGGNRYRAFASEGGHVDFAPTNEVQTRLLMYLQKQFNHVSYERVCSGKGLANIYKFLQSEYVLNEPEWLREQINNVSDPAPLITKSALDKSADIAIETMNQFISILGSAAGNLALKLMATGGIYLGGGILPRILPILEFDGFMSNFSAKGRFQELLMDIPVYLIRNSEAALLGAVCFGLDEWRSYGKNGVGS